MLFKSALIRLSMSATLREHNALRSDFDDTPPTSNASTRRSRTGRGQQVLWTDAEDLEDELAGYVERLESLGGIDLFFLGLGPEAGGASHLAYIKPGSGATYNDVAGLIPISQSILEHHINKFKAGGTVVTEADEAECRAARHILTLGPAAILAARRVVQSIVDADTAPAKPESYRQLLTTQLAADAKTRETQFDQNPGLWLRVHPNVRSLILQNVLLK